MDGSIMKRLGGLIMAESKITVNPDMTKVCMGGKYVAWIELSNEELLNVYQLWIKAKLNNIEMAEEVIIIIENEMLKRMK